MSTQLFNVGLCIFDTPLRGFLCSFLRSHSFSLRVGVDGAEYIQQLEKFQQGGDLLLDFGCEQATGQAKR